MEFEWEGIFTAITTQFTDEDKLDFKQFKKSLNAQLDGGIAGVIPGGTLGESNVLKKEELALN